MRKLSLIIVLLISAFLGLVGCINEAKDAGFLSQQKGKYSLYVVGDNDIDTKLEIEKIKSVFKFEIESNYKNAKENAPFLNIKDEKPNYFVFDRKELKYETTSYDKLVKFLKDHPNPK